MVPRWLSWLFVLFLGYIIVTGNRGFLTPEVAPEKAAREEHVAEYYPAIHALVDGERWKRAINPTYQEDKPCAPVRTAKGRMGSYAILEQPGSGKLAECGDTIRIRTILWDGQGKQQAALAPRDLVLGDQPGLDALLVSMGFDETRTLIFTVPKDGYKALPELKNGQLQMLTVTRVSAKEKTSEVTSEASRPNA